MNPSQFQERQQAKREINLKIHKNSHFIKKSPSSSSSLSLSSSSSSTSSCSLSAGPAASATTTTSKQTQQRQPVIIYTHSPKIIHADPRDFMSLVQRLTGLKSNGSPHEDPKQEGRDASPSEEDHNKAVVAADAVEATASDESDSSSVITDEKSTSTSLLGNMHHQINSCLGGGPAIFDPPARNPNCLSNIPFFMPSSEYLCPPRSFYSNYAEPLFLMPNMAASSSISSAPNLEGTEEFREF